MISGCVAHGGPLLGMYDGRTVADAARSTRIAMRPIAPIILFLSLLFPSDSWGGRPNVVFFLVDDLGWADLGCYGSQFHQTPNIDALAAGGMRFTQGYAACPVCSPTRASILTGRHPVRVEITDWIPGMRAEKAANRRFHHVDDRDQLALCEVTFAEHLRDQADYQTFFIGKWHLGAQGHWPTEQGFDVNIAGFESGSPPGGYYPPWNNPNLKAKDSDHYLTTRLTDEAIEQIASAKRDQPFLLYFSYYNVHSPIQPDRSSVDRFRQIAKERFPGPTQEGMEHDAKSRLRQDNPEYASMVAAVDTSVGRVLNAIDDFGLHDNTIVFFCSDNGGLCTLEQGKQGRVGPTSNLPLRSGKGWLYEGGIRVPMIVRAPNFTKPGTDCDTPVFSTDFFPTILDLIGLDAKPELHVDGTSLKPLFHGESIPERTLYWHYPHYHGSAWKPGAAIRDGQWKLIEFYETDETELYNIAEDVGEQINLANEHAEIRDRLSAKLRDWQVRMKAKMPVKLNQ